MFIKYKRQLGLLLGILIAIILYSLNFEGLSVEGKKCLAISLMTVIFWATNVAPSGYISALFLVTLILFKVSPASEVFSLWASSIIYLVIGAYLIAGGVNRSGLGERIAYHFTLKYVSSFKSLIISCFVLNILLGLIIPYPLPRCFLILSVMNIIIKSANITKKDSMIIGFTVFASSIPTSMIFLTADSTINIIAIALSTQKLSWLGWFYYMGVPAIFASISTCALIFILFKPTAVLNVDKEIIRNKLSNLGALTFIEKKTIFWMIIAVILWMTDSIHGIELGWITLLIAILMSMPTIGDIIDERDWKSVPIDTLLFLVAALSIGSIGKATGMNTWLASVILPSEVPTNIYSYAFLVVITSIFLHLFLGSVTSAMSIAIPAFISYSASSGINTLVTTFLVFSSVSFHYILPYQHMTILVGMDDNFGMYNDSMVIKTGFYLTFVVLVTVLIIGIPWWKITGLL